MFEEMINDIITELREGFGIPLFYSDGSLTKDIEEGHAYLSVFEKDIDYDSDKIARMLLKNYAYYSYQHIVDDFKVNYAASILEWHFSKIKAVDECEE